MTVLKTGISALTTDSQRTGIYKATADFVWLSTLMSGESFLIAAKANSTDTFAFAYAILITPKDKPGSISIFTKKMSCRLGLQQAEVFSAHLCNNSFPPS